jgi:class 3 adenylate cyclase
MAGLWLLLAQPSLDIVWEDHASHFGLVLAVALINVLLAGLIGSAARRRSDARLYLVALSFLTAAGFLGLHALATPGVVLAGPNAGFVLATPVGLFLAGIFAAASAADVSSLVAARARRWESVLAVAVVLLMAAWGSVSLLGIGQLGRPLDVEEARGPLAVVAWVGVALYLLAGLGYLRLYRRRPSVVSIGIVTAFALLAEALYTQTLARNWHASWWEWHLLMALAFGFVAYSAHVQYRREGSITSLFRSVSLEQTIRSIREEYAAALEDLVASLERGAERGATEPPAGVTARLAATFDLSEGQTSVLERAAEALFSERDQVRRLAAMAAIGRETRVIIDEEELLARSLGHLRGAFRRETISIGLLRDGRLTFAPGAPGSEGLSGQPSEEFALAKRAMAELRPVTLEREGSGTMALPITVKDRAAGVLLVERTGSATFDERERSLLESLASQLSIALENARLYRQIDQLFRQYMSPDVATALLSDPEQAALGGAIVEVTVLFADLRGFTSFSERAQPGEVVGMLNRYFEVVVPLVIGQGGTVVQFIGDAIMAIFNAPARQPDHALRAARAALEMQASVEGIAAGREGWPRFRVGLNTGPALVGNVGSTEVRSFTAIGDTVNLAARLQGLAEVGRIVIGEATLAELGAKAQVEPLGQLEIKGKARPVEAFVLRGLGES